MFSTPFWAGGFVGVVLTILLLALSAKARRNSRSHYDAV